MLMEGDMEQDNERLEIFNYLGELPLKVKRELKQEETYQRYVFERARLENMVTQSLEETGKLTSPAIMEQNVIVEDLGNAVLEKIKDIRFMQDEPSYEEIQKLLKKTE